MFDETANIINYLAQQKVILAFLISYYSGPGVQLKAHVWEDPGLIRCEIQKLFAILWMLYAS